MHTVNSVVRKEQMEEGAGYSEGTELPLRALNESRGSAHDTAISAMILYKYLLDTQHGRKHSISAWPPPACPPAHLCRIGHAADGFRGCKIPVLCYIATMLVLWALVSLRPGVPVPPGGPGRRRRPGRDSG
eukprot:1268408-Rhodomonas_salina.3